jgi:MoxR-like ATPase
VPGPIFANVLLADEINRTPPKTQSALLEAMQERSCTVRGNHYKLPSPFFVLATQNPIELEGTYPLPEAQLDRFLFNTVLDYLSAEEEMQVIDLTTTTHVAQVEPVTNARRDPRFQQLVRMVPIADSVARYAVDLVRATRHSDPSAPGLHPQVRQLRLQRARRPVPGAGGQGARPDEAALSRHLRRHPRAAHPVLRHRILLNFYAESDRLRPTTS